MVTMSLLLLEYSSTASVSESIILQLTCTDLFIFVFPLSLPIETDLMDWFKALDMGHYVKRFVEKVI